MEKSFLQIDVQSIVLLVCFFVSGISFAEYIEDINKVSMLYTCIGTFLVGSVLVFERLRKRKNDSQK